MLPSPFLNSTTVPHRCSFGRRARAIGAGGVGDSSVARLENGRTVGGFSCDGTLAGSNCTHMVYEADAAGRERARVRIPSPSADAMAQQRPAPRLPAWHAAELGGGEDVPVFGYRALPLTTIYGERRAD